MDPERSASADWRLALDVLRAPQWVHFIALPLAALPLDGLPALATGLVGAAGSLGYAYGLNAITDRHADDEPRKNPLAGLAAVPRAATASVLAAFVIALLAALAAGPVARLALCVSLAAGSLYSAGPRAKGWPVAGALMNLLIFAPLLYAGVRGGQPPAPGVVLVALVALLLQNQLLHELGDAAEDGRGADRTTAMLLGPRGTRGACVAVGLVGAAVCLGVSAPGLAGGFGAVAVLAGVLPAVVVGDAKRARVLHRRLSLVAGALTFLVVRVAA